MGKNKKITNFVKYKFEVDQSLKIIETTKKILK